MTPFAKPLAAWFRPYPNTKPDETEPVAIVAVDAEDYLAIDNHGGTVQAIHGQFEIVDWEVRDAVYRVLTADGS